MFKLSSFPPLIHYLSRYSEMKKIVIFSQFECDWWQCGYVGGCVDTVMVLTNMERLVVVTTALHNTLN